MPAQSWRPIWGSLLLLGALDWLSTSALVAMHTGHEGNPIMGALLATVGWPAWSVIKLVGTAGAVGCLAAARTLIRWEWPAYEWVVWYVSAAVAIGYTLVVTSNAVQLVLAAALLLGWY